MSNPDTGRPIHPVSFGRANEVVGRLRPTAQKVGNAVIQIFPTFRALLAKVQAGRNCGNGEEADPNAKNDLEHDNAYVVGDQCCSADNATEGNSA